MKKKIILTVLVLGLLTGCGKIPTLKNGEEAVVTFEKDGKESGISAEALFEELKANFGLEATIKLMDTYILETEYASYIEEAKKNAESYIKAMIESYGDENTLLSAIQQNTSYQTIEGYQEYLYLSFMQSHALEEYAKTLVTEKEINEYYKNEVKGDIEVYHILVTSKATDDMTDDEKVKEEEKAQNTIKDIIKELQESKDAFTTFKELAKSKSEDKDTVETGGNLGFINVDTLGSEYDELVDAAYKLKNGEFSTTVITTELGYHVIYRHATKEKAKLKDVKDSVIKALSEQKLTSEANIAVKSMENYRDMYNAKIVDSTLSRQYGIYLNNLENQTLNSQK